jgi:hypothetical protein
MKFKANLSTWEDPLWYVDDKLGYRSVFPFAIVKNIASNPFVSLVSYGIIIGPLFIRVCFGKKNKGE